jgi:hypothetical protein
MEPLKLFPYSWVLNWGCDLGPQGLFLSTGIMANAFGLPQTEARNRSYDLELQCQSLKNSTLQVHSVCSALWKHYLHIFEKAL